MPTDPKIIANQPHLFEMPPRPLDKRAAFGRVPHSNFFGIDPDMLRVEISDEDINRVQPENLRSALFCDSELSFGGVAFGPAEYEVIVRNEDSFEAAIGARALKASQLENNLERRHQKAERSKLHAYESKIERLDVMLKGLEQERVGLGRLLKEMQSPKFAHMSEAELRILATSVWELSFKNILHVAAQSNGWDTETADKAEKALTYQMTSKDYKANYRYWKTMTKVALEYATVRQRLTSRNKTNIENRVK